MNFFLLISGAFHYTFLQFCHPLPVFSMNTLIEILNYVTKQQLKKIVFLYECMDMNHLSKFRNSFDISFKENKIKNQKNLIWTAIWETTTCYFWKYFTTTSLSSLNRWALIANFEETKCKENIQRRKYLNIKKDFQVFDRVLDIQLLAWIQILSAIQSAHMVCCSIKSPSWEYLIY